MTLLEIAIVVMTISLSRIITPSPLVVATISFGTRIGWKAGLKIAYGHTLVALPLAIFLSFETTYLENYNEFIQIISIIGAVGLFAFAIFQVIFSMKKSPKIDIPKHGPFFGGILLTVLNPFFFLWWFTIGFKLISEAMILYSIVGAAVVFLSHLWMDYAWFICIGHFSRLGKKILFSKYKMVFNIALSTLFLYYGLIFLNQAFL